MVASVAQLFSVSYIAAGDYFEVPNGGEQSGYARNWLARGVKQRVTTNNAAAPVASVYERMPLKGQLKLPNARIAFALTEWQKFFDFAIELPFFIREVDELPESTSLCFNPNFDAPKAHASTRELVSLSISFDVYNGL